MKYIFISLMLSTVLYSCNDFRNQAMRVIYEGSIEVSALLEAPAITVDTLHLRGASKDVKLFYDQNKFKLGWSNANNRKQLIEAIHDLRYDGMGIAKYNIDILEGYNSRYDSLSSSDKVKSDIYFTKAYSSATDHLFNGVLNPRRLYNDWDIDKKELNTSATLLLALSNEAVGGTFDSLRTKQKVYTNYRNKLKALYELELDTLKVFKSIKLYDTLPSVIALKKHLMFLNQYEPVGDVDGIYTKDFIAGLKKYQTKNKLIASGFLDDKTLQSINAEEELIKSKLIVNLERWRWFPQNLGENYILVNIPDYSLISVSKTDTIQKHKVVVGKVARKTPILSSVLTTVVINPTWTVPPTIKKNDLIPSAQSNLSYFSSRNFTIYDGNGKVVAPENWNAAKGMSYRYVQKGGVGNTLGRVKFMFKNNHAVYLHDTPSQWGFAKNDRSLSSGCIRVEAPFELAQFIFDIEETNLTKEKIDEVLDSQKTSNYSVSKVPIEIHQLYWTAQVDQKGRIVFYNDVYDYDANLYKRLLN